MAGSLFDGNQRCEAHAFVGLVSKFHCIARFRLDGTLVEANVNFLNTMGYGADEIVGKHHRMFLIDPNTKDPTYEGMWPSFANGKAKAGEVLRRTKSGDVVWLQSVYCPERGDDGNVEFVIKLAVPKKPALSDDGVNVPLAEILE